MATTPRVCIFCGGTPVTSEHAWPQWIAKYLPRTKVPHLVLKQYEGRDDTYSFRGERLPFTTTVRCVCRDCNSGWLHELEGTAEPLLSPLIQGKSQVWHEWKQALAAAWAFKTMALLEYAVGEISIPADVMPLFRRFLTPPPGTQVWTGVYAGSGRHQFGSGAMRMLLVDEDGNVAHREDASAFGGFVQVGALVFRLRGMLIRDGPAETLDASMAKRLVQIRPVQPKARWPPTEPIDDDGLHLLVKSMADDSAIGDVPPANT